jgi:S-adenosylmethionine decarboxylase
MEWIVEAFDCEPDRLRDLDLVCKLCDQVIDDLGLNVLGQPQTHRFPNPAGVTTLYMLSESHLACHTYPEFRLATFNLYCCRARAAWDWSTALSKWLDAGRVETKQIPRGLPSRAPDLGESSSRSWGES